MCRIWGVSFGPDGPEAEQWSPSEMAQIMFPSLVNQGPDAFGWATWAEGDDDVDMWKMEGRCDLPWALDEMENINPQAKWIIGHTRWATHGSPAEMINNHPIHHGEFVGVHNGVIRNYSSILQQTGRQDPSCQVDSESIFAAVNKWGVRPGLSRIMGDMVAVFTDLRNPQQVYLSKSNGRPLVMARTKAGSLIWASEEQALDALGIDLFDYSELGANRVLTVEAGKIINRAQFQPFRPKMQKQLPAKKKPTTSTTRAHVPPTARRLTQTKMDEIRYISDKSGIAQGTIIEGLYYHSGYLLSKKEYDIVVAELAMHPLPAQIAIGAGGQ